MRRVHQTPATYGRRDLFRRIGWGCASLALTSRPTVSAGPKSVAKGNRVLGLAWGPPNGQENDPAAKAKAFKLAEEIGMGGVNLVFDWNVLEPEPLKLEGGALKDLNLFYPPRQIEVHLTIRPLHTNQKVVPKDLMDKALNSELVIERFNRLLDFVFSELADVKLASLVIGSEMDVYLGTDEELWKQWETFYKAAGEYAKTKRPGLKLAAEATYDNLTGPGKQFMRKVNEHSDVVGVSYYPLGSDFGVKNLPVVHAVFDEVTSLYRGKPIYFYQIGCPSGNLLNSSEEKQAQFFNEMFNAWDAHAEDIPFVYITWQHDISREGVDWCVKFYGLDDPKFKDFLGTLGLRSADGMRDKLAWQVVRAATKRRGWLQ